MIKLKPIVSSQNDVVIPGEPDPISEGELQEIIEGSGVVDKFLSALEYHLGYTTDLKKIQQINEIGWASASLKAVPIFTNISSEELVLPSSLEGIDKENLKKNVAGQLKALYTKNKSKFKMLVSMESQDIFSWFFNQGKIAVFYSNMLKEKKRKVFNRLDDVSVAKFKAYRLTIESYTQMGQKLDAMEHIQKSLEHFKNTNVNFFSSEFLTSEAKKFQPYLGVIGLAIDPMTLRVRTADNGMIVESLTLGELDWSPTKIYATIDKVIHLLDGHKIVGETIKTLEKELADLKKAGQDKTPTASEVQKALLFTTSVAKHVTHLLYRITNQYSTLCERVQTSRT